MREHAAGVLASLLKSGDEELSRDFRDRAYSEALSVLRKRKQRLKLFLYAFGLVCFDLLLSTTELRLILD